MGGAGPCSFDDDDKDDDGGSGDGGCGGDDHDDDGKPIRSGSPCWLDLKGDARTLASVSVSHIRLDPWHVRP